MNLGEIKDRVWDRLDEISERASDVRPRLARQGEIEALRYPAEDVTEFVNDGIQHLAVRAASRVTTTTITQRPRVLFYQLPSDHVRTLSLYDETNNQKVYPTTLRQLDDEWTGGAALSHRWPRWTGTRPRLYAEYGMEEILLWPLITSGTVSVTLTYVEDPGTADVSSDSDTPSVPVEWHELLVDYAVGRALVADSQLEVGMEFLGAYLAAVDKVGRRRRNRDRVWTHRDMQVFSE